MTDKSPPAFPIPELNVHDGMSLLDYFAAAALTGILASGGSPLSTTESMAYTIALRMIDERNRLNAAP